MNCAAHNRPADLCSDCRKDGLISREHRAKAARIAEELIDHLHEDHVPKDADRLARLAAAIRDLDAVSRGP